MIDLIHRYKTWFYVLFGVTALGLVISMLGVTGGTGGPGLFNAGSLTPTTEVARVNGDVIRTRELLLSLQNERAQFEENLKSQMGGNNNPETAKFMEQLLRAQVTPQRVLSRLVQQKFLVQTAREMGVEASPEAVRSMIEKNPAFQKEGRFDPLSYKQMVTHPADYERELSNQVQFTGLSKAFESGFGLLSPKERELKKLLATPFPVETLEVKNEVLAKKVSVTDAEVKDYAAKAENEAAIQSRYNSDSAKYNTAEEVNVKHILVADEALAKDLKSQIESGKLPFEDAAKKHSTDKANASKGGDLGFFGRGVMDPAFEKASFELQKKGEIAGPVKSSFGFHLIKFEGRKEAKKTPLESVKVEIASQLLKESKAQNVVNAVIEKWIKDGRVSDADLKTYGLSWKTHNDFSPSQPQLPGVPSIQEHLVDILKLGETGQMLSKAILVGETRVLVRKAAPKAPEKAETKPSDSLVSDSNDRVEAAFLYFLDSRYKKLNETKKIVMNDKALQSISESMEPQQ